MPSSVLAIVGPTASGKSKLGLDLAHELGNLEIINADAMQLYRGMDIGTAKLGEQERQGVKHHLIDAVAIDQELTAVQYAELVSELLPDIWHRGAVPTLVGGSMFYLASALNQMDFAPTDADIRARLEAEAASQGTLNLHKRLSELDPLSAAQIPAQNTRRVVRALEVIEITGGPYSASLPEPIYRVPTIQLGIEVDREILRERIRNRVEQMWEQGILDEVQRLIDSGLGFSRTARMAIGYSQAIAQLEGRLSEKQAIEETINLTNRYARRQMSWFRRDKRIAWLDSQDNLTDQALERIRLGG